MENFMINFDNPSPRKVETKKPKYSPTDFHVDRKFQPLEGGQYQKIDGMWNFKHEISSQTFYELFINTKLKGDTDTDIRNLYNQINT